MNARYVPVRYFFIALVPIFIFYQESVISGQLMAADLEVSAGILTENWAWAEAAGRFKFLGATWFFAALAMLVFVLVLLDLARPTKAKTRIAATVVLVVIFTLAVMPIWHFEQNPDAPRNFHRLGAELFETALGRGTLPGCVSPDDSWLLGRCGDNPVVSLLIRMMDVVNVFAGLGVGALIVGMILCLEQQPKGDKESQAVELNRNLQRMRRQLYLSGLVLTFGMFFATSWMRWPIPMIDAGNKPVLDAYVAVVSSASLFTGLYFSLLILSFYLPVALVLDGRRRRLAMAAEEDAALRDPKVRADWLKVRGLHSDPAEVFKSGFALAAPVLAAFAGNVPISV